MLYHRHQQKTTCSRNSLSLFLYLPLVLMNLVIYWCIVCVLCRGKACIIDVETQRELLGACARFLGGRARASIRFTRDKSRARCEIVVSRAVHTTNIITTIKYTTAILFNIPQTPVLWGCVLRPGVARFAVAIGKTPSRSLAAFVHFLIRHTATQFRIWAACA